ncbi:glycoside hydrolase family 43 protein [Aurantiacibacter xanthus]|uniref:Glycoside hydrolase family 43 protein n=1 Tax=Aurantiacibacter xanthus TaxID=1784712 RepID=A0A3A1P493_9SPHN|nr:glycoside hydrolase family 43 protein [Aurantiacibacter xanthus]RIV86106.1 glycoside hydrolase family 43 protein [Aurantiacibacter xanthus]
MGTFTNPVLRGFNPDPSIVRVGEDFYIATSTFEWFPGVQIHHSRDLVNWRLAARPLASAAQLDMRGNPDGCGVWAPDLSYADGRFWLVFTDVKRYGQTTVAGARGASMRDFHNYVVSAPSIEGPWSPASFLNASGFDPALFHDDDGRSYMLNMLWDHRPGTDHFGGIVLQEFDRDSMRLIGKRQLVYSGSGLGFTEGPHLYKRDGWYHLLVAEGGTGWDHAVSMARSRELTGPYEPYPDRVVLSARGAREGTVTRAGHGDLVELPDGSTWMAYLCGRPLPGLARCVLGRESALQPMVWGEDGWLRTVAGDAMPDPAPPLPDLTPAPWPVASEEVIFDSPQLPGEFQWLRSPEPEKLFSLTARPGYLRLFGRGTIMSHFEQALVARRQEHHAYEAETEIVFDPQNFQQTAGLVCYYNTSKFHYLQLTRDGGQRELRLMSAIPNAACTDVQVAAGVPEGPLELRAKVDGARLQFSWRPAGEEEWREVGPVLDASILSDEVSLPGWPNFTGTFVGMACQDMAGTAIPADFRRFLYRPA